MKKILSVSLILIIMIFSVALAANPNTPQFLLDRFKMKLGDTQAIAGIINGKIDYNNFESSNEDVVEILPNGNLKAKTTGYSTLTYTYQNNGRDVVISCHIEVTRYDSTFDTISGTEKKETVYITLDLGDYKVVESSNAAAIPVLPKVTRTGYILEGWYTEASFTNKVKDNQRFFTDATLYPKWLTQAEYDASKAVASALYDDTTGHWAQVAIDAVSYKGLFNGVAERTFGPEIVMTRAMAVAVIGRLEDVDASSYKAKFDDVKEDAYYAGYLAWAVENKIVTDVKNDKFRPNDEITREEVAVYIANYMNYKKYDADRILSLPYKDIDELSSNTKECLDLLYNTAIMQGTSTTTFEPTMSVTRAQMAQIFYNLYNFSMRYKG